MNKRSMLYYNITDVSKGIDVNKAIAFKECDICHYLPLPGIFR